MTSSAESHANPLAHGDTAQLYRAAIGPRGQAYYLRHFLKFDADGKTSANWNWAAYASTLNWLVFRRMWGYAMVYAAVLFGVALGIFGVGKLAFNYSDATGLGLFLAVLALAFVLPGIYGNALYYNFCNQKISKVLNATPDLPSALQVLTAQASTPQRAYKMALVNGVVLAALAGGVFFMQQADPQGAAMSLANRANPVAGRLNEAAKPVPPPAASTVQSGVLSQPEATEVKPPDPVVASPAPPATPVEPPKIDTPKVDIPKAPEPKVQEPVKPQRADKVPSQKPVVAAKPASPQSEPSAPSSPKRLWFVQAGAFSQEANAQAVRDTLDGAGIKSSAVTSDTPAGQLTRIRVGPFDTLQEAQNAALQLKALDLPAALFRE